ncbi:MAG: TonB-dependent receptor [Gammaproteobacteria bacterium]|nr:TonB-dependent receptor [Gammaproteobacteria bacterium]
MLLLLFSFVGASFANAEAKREAIEEIVVTGTHIKGADIEGVLPVTVLDAEEIQDTGSLTGEDLLRSIPQVGSIGFGASRGGITGVNAARGDVASFNLRSIGEGNTLTLINGRRMVLHPITQTSSFDGVPVASANANTLPAAALQRVEVLRDGAGAIYGADAVAGVINYVLNDDYEGFEISIRGGEEEGTERADATISGAWGTQFNNGRTGLVVSGSYTNSNGVDANDYDFSSNQDLRSRAPDFASDLSLDQRSSLEPHARVNFNGLGLFHVRPATLMRDNGSTWGVADCGGRGLDGADLVYSDGLQDLCLDSSGQDRAIRPNRNEVRTLVPDIERYNIFARLTHELDNGFEVYGEASYYSAEATRQWEQSAILSNGRFFVEADYYYNPFGPVTFDDGRPNPNRLPGLDPSIVPVEGLGFQVNSLRPTDTGPREIEVESTSYRFVGGLTGNIGEWEFDTALVYSEAEVDDTASNRISTPLFQAQINRDTPDAYNIFTGVNPADPTSIIDATPNPRSSIDPFIVSASRKAETTLTLVDFKLSNANLFELPAGNVALALGVEYRQEELDEDNSAIFDGSMPFIDPLDPGLAPGEITNASSLEGSSVRPDVAADRQVFSAFAEAIIPLISDVPGIHSLDAQVAVRYENFDDVGTITRPKFALSWYPIEQIQFRAAFSQGFRAPNLIQLNSPGTSITTSVQDFAEGIALGTGDINSGPANGNYILETAGNQDLDPEKSDNFNIGVVFTPIENLTFTADYWEIESEDTVGVFSDENESRLDAVLRASGSSNPSVMRAAPDEDNPLGEILRIVRRYENLNTRKVEGVDIGVYYSVQSAIGTIDIRFNAAKLTGFDQAPGGAAQQLVDFGANTTVLGASVGDVIEREFFPKWRRSASITWNSSENTWGAGAFYTYVGEVFEPSVRANNEFFFVDDHATLNLHFTHRGLFGDGSSIRFGVNNVTDEEPPLASESLGFEGELHSSRGRYMYLQLNHRFGSQ